MGAETYKVAKCSPRTRGWSLNDVQQVRERVVLPAYAGMVPCRPLALR